MIVLGMGIGIVRSSAGMGVLRETPPTYPSVFGSRLWLNRFANVYTDTAGTAPAAVNDSVASWRAVGGGWGNDLLTQATGSQQPVLKSDGIQADGVDDHLLFPSTLTLSGDFTIYCVLTKVDDSGTNQWIGDGGSGVNQLGWLGNFAYGFCNSIQGVDALDSIWVQSIRRVRRSGTTWYYKQSGAAENSKAGSSANFPLTMLLRSSATLASNRRFQQLVVLNKLITPGDADDLAIIAKLQQLESGVSGP